MAKGLLVLAYYFPPDSESGAQRPFRFAKYLQDHGYRAHVITASPQGQVSPWRHVSQAPNGGGSWTSAAIGSRIGRLIQRFLPYNDQLPWVPHAIAAARDVITAQIPGAIPAFPGGAIQVAPQGSAGTSLPVPVSAVLSTSPPLAAHLAALWLKRRYGLKWIADFRDPVVGSPFRKRKIGPPYDAALERLIFRHADAVVTVTDTIHDVWCRRYPRWAHKAHVIWNGFDPEERLGPLPIPSRAYRVLAHAGSIYGGRHPGPLLASLERLIRRGLLESKGLRVRLVGYIDENTLRLDQPPASSLIAEGCLECRNCIVPRREAIQAMAEADFLILCDGNDTNLGYAAPAKLFEYIRIGRPILGITARNSPVDRILAKSGVPYSCIYHDDCEARIDNRVLSFLTLSADPSALTSWFLDQFDGKRQTARLASIIDDLLAVPGVFRKNREEANDFAY